MEHVIIWGWFFGTGLIFSIWEAISPCNEIKYKKRILRDLATLILAFFFPLIFGFMFEPIRLTLFSDANVAQIGAMGIGSLPDWAKLVLFFVSVDFSIYWAHRSMHTSKLWPMHKWHHIPEDIWWLSGMRASFTHTIFFQLAFIWFWFYQVPLKYSIFIFSFYIIQNNWMHINVRPGKWMKPFELLFVTPRFHRIHHSDNPGYYVSNCGSVLTIWDRLFNTYIDPDEVDYNSMTYGISEEVPALKLMVGFETPQETKVPPGEPVIAGKEAMKVQVEGGKTYMWCSCGRSSNQPWCDGSHKGTVFEPVPYTARRTRQIQLCSCKLTKKGPFCDAAHTKL